MKKIFTALALAALTCTASVFAQDSTQQIQQEQHHRRHHGPRQQKFAKLNLTDTQRQEMRTLRAATRQQLQNLEKQDHITLKEYREKKAAILKASKEKVDAILTLTQKDQLAQFKKDRQHHAGARKAQRLVRMKETLGLTDDQLASLRQQSAARNATLDSIRNNTSLSEAQKKEALLQWRKEQQTAFDQVLTPAQKEKLANLRKERITK